MLIEEIENLSKVNADKKNVLSLFEEDIHLYANAIAIIDNENEITYGALNKKANDLADHLINSGVIPNTIVAVYLEPSIDFIISILAIIKAGAAYLPLDIETAFKRANEILQDSNPVKIITTSSLATRLNIHQDRFVVINQSLFNEISAIDHKRNTYLNSSEDLLYIMYTSGSTGIPKGCMIPHRAVVNLATNKEFSFLKKNERIAHISNLAFDASTFEIWGALLNRATLFIYPRAKLVSMDSFSSFLKKNKITILFLTTAYFNLIVKNKPDCFDQLNFLLFGGEKANPEKTALLLNRKKMYNLNNLNVINVYGPTENTTFSTKFTLDLNLKNKLNIPIGKPLANIDLYLFDEKYHEVPDNTEGEIYLGGENLALGYLNDTASTNDKFILHPKSGKIIYKTGDFGYRDKDGQIVYTGRKDNQFKIRGYRVEVNEIELILSKFKFIEQVLVDVISNGRDPIIVAYIVPTLNNEFSYQEFHHFLHENVPDYMLPRSVYLVDFFPLNINGKIDKEQLREMDLKSIFNNEIQQPSNQIELLITTLLSKLLKISDICIDYNFFDLGMNSLLVVEACAQMNNKIKTAKKIEEIDFYTYPTIKLLANYIADNKENREFADCLNRASLQRNAQLRKHYGRY